ncbi:DNA_polymerase [Hexamita inflata]|uniref:DNA-directed DNA polymerase n=1 Tax=Hexamita inflata TaxID=28002 RepID=A0AA86UTK3_9EUKA|nr:DNA polymerase [Hexamita inflata]
MSPKIITSVKIVSQPIDWIKLTLEQLRNLKVEPRYKNLLRETIEQREQEQIILLHNQNRQNAEQQAMEKLLRQHTKQLKAKVSEKILENDRLKYLQEKRDQEMMSALLRKTQQKYKKDQDEMEKLLKISKIQHSNDIEFLKQQFETSDDQTQQLINKRLHEIYDRTISQMTEEQVDQYIASHKSYNSNVAMEIEFYYKFTDKILKHNLGQLLEITPTNAPTKLIMITTNLIQRINEYMFSGLRDENSTENYNCLEKQICNCLSIRFIKHGVTEQLQNEKLFTKLQEFQGKYNYFVDETFYPTEEGRQYLRKQGAYFNYYLTISLLDLSKYQIYNNETEIGTEHCFIFALQQSGQYTQDELDQIKIQFVSIRGLLTLANIKNIQGLKPLCIASVPTNCDYSEKIKIQYTYLNNNKTSYVKDSKIDYVNIACIANHYFINDLAPCSLNWIKNYETYKDDERYQNYLQLDRVRKDTAKVSFSRLTKISATALEIVIQLFRSGYFEKIQEMNMFNQDLEFDLLHPPKILYYPNIKQQQKVEEEGEEQIEEEIKHKVDQIYIADFETFTTSGKYNDNMELERIAHKEFLICYDNLQGTNKGNGRNVMALVNNLKRQYQTIEKDINICIYMHNLSYDSAYIIFKNIPLHSPLKFNGKIIAISSTIFLDSGRKINLKFQDSNLLFQTALKKLPSMFPSAFGSEPIQKEYFPYDYYNETRYLENEGDIKQALKYVEDATLEQFCESISKAGAMLPNGKFNMQLYALYYCELDVEILRRSINIFQEQLLSEFNLHLTNFMSISRLAYQYQVNQGCYEGVEPLTGLARKYVQQSIIGGRVMIQNNTRIKTNVELSDFDAVSLYPSAMAKIYFPTGQPQHMTEEMIKYYNDPENLNKLTEEQNSPDQNSLYMTVKFILDNNYIPRDFPLQSQVNEKTGTREFTNNVFDKYFHVDHQALQDIVKFQKVKYEIISGIYYQGRNYKIQDVIKFMFQKRLTYKGAGNPLEVVYKLMLNSLYGYTIQKDRLTENQIWTQKQFNEKSLTEFQRVEDMIKINQKYFVTLKKELIKQEGYQHVGSLILSMSKRITNEVICTADDIGCKTYYTDTDSIHISRNQIADVASEYQKRFGRQLIGKQLGQFHSDFQSKLNKADNNIYACESIFIDKKIYIDKLVVTLKDGTKAFDYHYRAKGITEKAIIEKYQNEFENNPMKLYQAMYDGQCIEFNMLAGKPSFDFKDFVYTSQNTFTRKIQVK